MDTKFRARTEPICGHAAFSGELVDVARGGSGWCGGRVACVVEIEEAFIAVRECLYEYFVGIFSGQIQQTGGRGDERLR